MKTKIQKWGNSLAVRIPRVLADQFHLAENTEVELFSEESGINIKPARKEWSLSTLISSVNKRNLHSECETGAAVGNEVW